LPIKVYCHFEFLAASARDVALEVYLRPETCHTAHGTWNGVEV